MAAVSPVSSGSKTTLDMLDGAPSRLPQKTLGQDDFLKLLATQFSKQDPMKPMEDTAFIAQMAQFSALEQSSALVKQVAQLRANQDLFTANSYIGRNVTVDLGEDATHTGNVSGVDVSTGTPRLIIGGEKYSLSAVLRVEPGAPTAIAPAATTSITPQQPAVSDGGQVIQPKT